jgi:hypothetical protein
MDQRGRDVRFVPKADIVAALFVRLRLTAQPRNANTCDAIAQTFRARGPNQSG